MRRFSQRLANIRQSHSGFELLAQIHHNVAELKHCIIELDMSRVSWFAAEMAAPLAVLVRMWRRNGNQVEVVGLRQEVGVVLRRNRFLCETFGDEPAADGWGTSIPFFSCHPSDLPGSAEYAKRSVLGHSQWPAMTDGVRKVLWRNLAEVFQNVDEHASTDFVAACGQWFHQRNLLSVMVADGGNGIPRNVREHLSIGLTDVAAVDWALKRGHSTKRGVMGGLGLHGLREFVQMNRGSLDIVSNQAYVRLGSTGAPSMRLGYAFPGTVVHLSVRTDDRGSYALDESESQRLFER